MPSADETIFITSKCKGLQQPPESWRQRGLDSRPARSDSAAGGLAVHPLLLSDAPWVLRLLFVVPFVVPHLVCIFSWQTASSISRVLRLEPWKLEFRLRRLSLASALLEHIELVRLVSLSRPRWYTHVFAI
jgi:hypothetical protein